MGENNIRNGVVGLLLAGCLTAPAMSAIEDKPFFRAASVVIVFGGSDFKDDGGEAPIVFDFHVLDDAVSGQAAPDLIGTDGRTVITDGGELNPIQSGEDAGWAFQINNETFGGDYNSNIATRTLDSNDSYTAFGLDNSTDVDLLGNAILTSRFFVASNVPFDVFGQASNLTSSGDFNALDYSNIRFRFRYNVTGGSGATQWGQSAQDPAPSGNGVTYGGGVRVTLDGMVAAPRNVFRGERRTARTAGSIMEQAISFQARYNLDGASTTGNNYDFSQGIGTLGADVTYTVYTP